MNPHFRKPNSVIYFGDHGERQEGLRGWKQGGGEQGEGDEQGGEQVHLRDLHLRVSFSTLIASHNGFISQEGVFPLVIEHSDLDCPTELLARFLNGFVLQPTQAEK